MKVREIIMNRMSLKVLQNLKNIHTNIKFTIYLPLEPGPENTAANISTLHKTVALLRQVLKDVNIPVKDQQKIIKNVLKLEGELGHQMPGKGIAVFIFDTNEVDLYALPFRVQPIIYYGLPSMHLEPLKKYYKKTNPYWVLTLSQNGCKLFRGNGKELKAIDDTKLQEGMLSTLRLDEVNNPDIQGHVIKAGGQKASEGFHGHGGFKDMRKKYLHDYFRIMDKRLHQYALDKTEPVILVGTDNIQSIYKKITGYKNIMSSQMALNPHSVTKTNILQLVSPMLDVS